MVESNVYHLSNDGQIISYRTLVLKTSWGIFFCTLHTFYSDWLAGVAVAKLHASALLIDCTEVVFDSCISHMQWQHTMHRECEAFSHAENAVCRSSLMRMTMRCGWRNFVLILHSNMKYQLFLLLYFWIKIEEKNRINMVGSSLPWVQLGLVECCIARYRHQRKCCHLHIQCNCTMVRVMHICWSTTL